MCKYHIETFVKELLSQNRKVYLLRKERDNVKQTK